MSGLWIGSTSIRPHLMSLPAYPWHRSASGVITWLAPTTREPHGLLHHYQGESRCGHVTANPVAVSSCNRGNTLCWSSSVKSHYPLIREPVAVVLRANRGTACVDRALKSRWSEFADGPGVRNLIERGLVSQDFERDRLELSDGAALRRPSYLRLAGRR